MTSIAGRVLAATTLMVTSAFAAPTNEMFTPGLPANTNQFLECRIMNVSGSTQIVTSEAFLSNGSSGAGSYTQTLAPGEGGGFSIAGFYANMYCKFTVKGSTSGFRVSIDVLEPGTPERIVVALPGY